MLNFMNSLRGALMKRPGIAMLFAVGLLLVSCGGGNSDTIDGNWTAALSGAQTLNFHTTLNTQTGAADLMVTNLEFNPATTCFPTPGSGGSATFTSTGVVNGNITGAFSMSIGTLFPGPTQNLLVLQGNVNGRTISGTWTLTGGVVTTCTVGSGNFTMTKM
jgi:hypothetical protein